MGGCDRITRVNMSLCLQQHLIDFKWRGNFSETLSPWAKQSKARSSLLLLKALRNPDTARLPEMTCCQFWQNTHHRLIRCHPHDAKRSWRIEVIEFSNYHHPFYRLSHRLLAALQPQWPQWYIPDRADYLDNMCWLGWCIRCSRYRDYSNPKQCLSAPFQALATEYPPYIVDLSDPCPSPIWLPITPPIMAPLRAPTVCFGPAGPGAVDVDWQLLRAKTATPIRIIFFIDASYFGWLFLSSSFFQPNPRMKIWLKLNRFMRHSLSRIPLCVPVFVRL